jgi:hypothetical protein
MRRMRHLPIREQASHLNQVLRGRYAYYGIAGNFWALQRVHRAVERYWRKMPSSRSWKGEIWWKAFHQLKERFPLLRPKLYLPPPGSYKLSLRCEATSDERSAGNPHATFCGSRGRVTAAGDLVEDGRPCPLCRLFSTAQAACSVSWQP